MFHVLRSTYSVGINTSHFIGNYVDFFTIRDLEFPIEIYTFRPVTPNKKSKQCP